MTLDSWIQNSPVVPQKKTRKIRDKMMDVAVIECKKCKQRTIWSQEDWIEFGGICQKCRGD